LDEVSDGPRVPGGQSAGAWRTVRVLPADGPFFGVRYWRFEDHVWFEDRWMVASLCDE
jgi:hypothetical protein